MRYKEQQLVMSAMQHKQLVAVLYYSGANLLAYSMLRWQ